MLESSLSGALTLPPDCEHRCFVDHKTTQDPDVVLAPRCAVSQVPALLLAVHSSAAGRPDRVYCAAPLARRERRSNSLNSETQHGSSF